MATLCQEETKPPETSWTDWKRQPSAIQTQPLAKTPFFDRGEVFA
jgi:hypothetical protein